MYDFFWEILWSRVPWDDLESSYHHHICFNVCFIFHISSILSRWPNHCSLISYKYFLMLVNFSLFLSYSPEILSSGLTLHIHLSILASLLSGLINSSSLNSQISFPYSRALCTHAEYNLLFAPKGKPLLANKGI